MNGGHKPTIERARGLRRNETDVEYRLWYELRARRLNGFKFVRQFPVGPYFADFACRTHHLIVELDGSQHAGSKGDILRTAFLNANGFSVLRFWNGEVQGELNAVLETILGVLEGRIVERSDGDGLLCGVRFDPATMRQERSLAASVSREVSRPRREEDPVRGLRVSP
ncbi:MULTISPECIES: DUF559 domain-containing protein [unclassified Aureimonas]|uniref:DUF559 domain-containing protein n=1 Tax=unclassified Aureimonas TaxID=2615206 RepID=UPI0009E8BF44|nr:endonuclease domain-containing protein [Aureimonas sp. Leaf427]